MYRVCCLVMLAGCNLIFGVDGSTTTDQPIDAVIDVNAPTDQVDALFLDEDRDGISNGDDNCPGIANSDQAHALDGDGIGDACDRSLGLERIVSALYFDEPSPAEWNINNVEFAPGVATTRSNLIGVFATAVQNGRVTIEVGYMPKSVISADAVTLSIDDTAADTHCQLSVGTPQDGAQFILQTKINTQTTTDPEQFSPDPPFGEQLTLYFQRRANTLTCGIVGGTETVGTNNAADTTHPNLFISFKGVVADIQYIIVYGSL